MTETEKILYTIHHGIAKAQIDTVYHEISLKELFILLDQYKSVIVELFTESLIRNDIELLYADTLVSHFNQLCIRLGRTDLVISIRYGLIQDQEDDLNHDEIKSKKEALETLFISNLPINNEKQFQHFFLVCKENDLFKARIITDSEIINGMEIVKVPIGYKAQAENDFKKFYAMINYIPTAPIN